MNYYMFVQTIIVVVAVFVVVEAGQFSAGLAADAALSSIISALSLSICFITTDAFKILLRHTFALVLLLAFPFFAKIKFNLKS